MRARDNQRERVYSAEKSLVSWVPISNWISWERNESQVRLQERWKRRHPEHILSVASRPEPEQRPMTLAQVRKYVRVKVGSAWWRKEFSGRGIIIEVVDRRSDAHASCHTRGYVTATLKFPKWSRWPVVILHELAHAVTPSGRAWHGSEFAVNFIKLVSHYIGVEEAKALKAAFRQNRVDYRRSNGTHGN